MKPTSNDFEINLPFGTVTEAHFLSSPFCDNRPADTQINLLVIHCISLPVGQYETPYVNQLFLGKLDYTAHPSFEPLKNLKVSPHLYIERSGKLIQYVPFSQRAWHAGKSSFQGKSHCNDFSIGIELAGTDTSPFEENQYKTLSRVTRSIQHAYPAITKSRIVGHSDIAPTRKTDPGLKFNWKKFKDLL